MPPQRQIHHPPRRERRRAETRERLFRSALQLFAQRGFTATTISHITEAADVGKGTFFNYFPSKEHIFTALAEIQLGNVQAALEDARRGEEPIGIVFRRLARSLSREPGRSPALFRSLVTAVAGNEAVREIFLGALQRGRQLISEIFFIGQQRREVRADREPLEMARIFQQTFFGTMVLWTLHPPSELADWVDSTMEIFWSGVQFSDQRVAAALRRQGSAESENSP